MEPPPADPAQPNAFDVALVGGGLQSALILLALRRLRPEARVVMVEREPQVAGNHTWCFHAGDVPAAAREVVAPLVVARWPAYDVRFEGLERTIDDPYACITSESVRREVEAASRPPGVRLVTGAEAVSVDATSVRLADGRRFGASLVVDSRGPGRFAPRGAAGWQKFVGLELEVEPALPFTRPVLMDATVAQEDGYRFFYVLPLSQRRVLVEDTYFSDAPSLDRARLARGALAWAAAHGLHGEVVREEQGVLPLPEEGIGTPTRDGVLLGGYQGGWFHPTTGYSFPVALRLALHVASRSPAEVFGPAFDRLVAEHRRQWRFAAWLNRLLFRAVQPHDRHHVLARFHRMPEATIRRFYALSTTGTDRARILCGRPPRGVSLRAALDRGLFA
ncbi:MAG: lycopene beta-cyclase CrtY [Polyangiaceae bacterium]|nr:lycopene beta-cyclase CrtY [Polyangiaceae bacterium]